MFAIAGEVCVLFVVLVCLFVFMFVCLAELNRLKKIRWFADRLEVKTVDCRWIIICTLQACYWKFKIFNLLNYLIYKL